MDRRQGRVVLAQKIDKENDHKNVNKRNGESLSKIDRLFHNKKHHEDKDIIPIKNSKDLRVTSKSVSIKPKIQNKITIEQNNLSNTQHYCKTYAEELIEINKNSIYFGDFLHKHHIDKNLRARMLDWMIQVMSSYKYNAKTYFTGVHIMDRYFLEQKQKLPITLLHIIGSVSMMIATKMDQVFPMKVKNVYQKIVHKKMQMKQIVNMEARISEKLCFVLNAWTFYDQALVRLHLSHSKNQDALNEIQKYCQIIGKFMAFNYEFYGKYETKVLGQSLLHVACKVYGWQKSKLLISNLDHYDYVETAQCISEIIKIVRSYKQNFENLTNIFKFSNQLFMNNIKKYFEY